MIEVLKQALEALERSVATCYDQYAHQQVMSQPNHFINQTITSLRQAIKELESQEPVAWHEPGAFGNVTTHKDWALANNWQPLYTHPQPKHEWVETTEKDVHECFMLTEFDYHVDFNRDPEQWCLAFAKELSDTLKQKNGYAEENT